MKTLFLLAVVFGFYPSLQGQFYYYDLVATQQTNQLYTQLRNLGIKKINGISYDRGEPLKDFLLEQQVSLDGTSITTRSASIGNAESIFIGYYKGNKVSRTLDSNTNAINTIEYDYDASGSILSINLLSKDIDGAFANKEQHIWQYDEKGLPVTMLKIKNNIDTTVISFVTDAQNNVTEEKWTKKGNLIETFYYYYNNKRLLTDIVRYNRKAKALLPDYIFEYDEMGNIIQMTQTQSGNANYLIWRYAYNNQGLKEREVAFNKQKELVGRVEYKYE